MKITMREVAAHAHVSVATVSHVINNSRFVKEETRIRVQKAIEDLNYTPDISARTLKTGKKNAIGFIVPDISSSFFAAVIESIENNLAEKNYKLIIANSKEDPNREIESIRLLSSGFVDGLIISSTLMNFEKIYAALPKRGSLPVVFIARSITDCPLDSVMISDYQAVLEGVKNLLADGHTKIGYISSSVHLSPSRERLDAYQAALNAYQIPFDPSLVRNAEQHAFSAIQALLKSGCTALVASTNNVTTDAMTYFLNHHILLKKEIALLGFLNDDSTSQALSNMHQVLHPIDALGKQAVSQLLHRMAHPDAPIKNIVLMGRYIH